MVTVFGGSPAITNDFFHFRVISLLMYYFRYRTYSMGVMSMKFSTLLVLLTCVSVAFGQMNSSFYVATTGNDSNPGTQMAPWRTIQHAADTARAGSTVYVRGGIYEELVSINRSGNTRDGFITFQSSPGETAVIDATRFTPSGRQGVLTIHNQSYVRIEGFEIRNFHTAEHRLAPLGIDVMGSGSHIELLKNNVHHIEQTFEGRDAPGSGGNGFGIAVYGTDARTPISELVIDGNEVHHLQTGSSESLVVNGNVTNFRITHNIVHDNNNIGIDVIGFSARLPTLPSTRHATESSAAIWFTTLPRAAIRHTATMRIPMVFTWTAAPEC